MRTNAELAVRALVQVRETIGMNVSYTQVFVDRMTKDNWPVDQARRRRNFVAVNALRKKRPRSVFVRGVATRAMVVAYGEMVLANGVGNCGELSCAAACMVDAFEEHPPWNIVIMHIEINHAFLVIAPPPVDEFGLYLNDIETWPEDCAVCDPWLDIACRARDFPDNFRRRMQNYQHMQLYIRETDDEAIHPMNWLHMLTAQKKPLVTVADLPRAS